MEPHSPRAIPQGLVNLNVSRFEITDVYTHPNAKVDIILVHGLNGQPKRTWTASNSLYWPAELLPETLKDCHANVLVYGYNADVYSRSSDASPSDNFIYQHAMSLVSHLTAHRKSKGASRNPIIWIAHSLGGILVKRALLYSNDLRDVEHEAFRSIYVSTYGIIFLGTPHTGSGLAFWGRVLQGMSALAPKKLFDSESILIKSLKQDNERLQEINTHFLDIYQRFRIQMVHENQKTDLKGTKAFVVDKSSACPQLPGVTYYGIEADHSHMCKFDGPNAPGYRTMTTAVQEWVKEAPDVIEVRWRVEEEDSEARTRREMDERLIAYASLRARNKTGTAERHSDVLSRSAIITSELLPIAVTSGGFVESPTFVPGFVDAATSPLPLLPPLVSTAASDASTARPGPLFLHPEKFRPNSYFIGRTKELEELHQKLTDSTRRSEGTSAVVIQSLPGGGKTHLARQYVFQRRSDYPGGIYWVRAKSISEMEEFFWLIAKNGALRNVVEKMTDNDPDVSGDTSGSQKEVVNPHNIVDIVRAWFSSFDQWLLVFDGIDFNTPDIDRFIPDAKNTSIIYTSIQSNVTGRYRFDNPQIMRLGMLSSAEARDLLLTEMERRKPWKEEDQAQALDIVKRMGYLPLMVHTAALHIKATQEPLSKYLRTLQNRTWAGELPAYQGVWEELKSRGAYPALNLMYILAFFGGRVPVGFLNLGLRALDHRTPVMTRDATHRSRSLNNSLRMLIAFALIERSEAGTVSPSSSQNDSKKSNGSQNSSKHNVGKTAESVDLLLIHTVVQRFFVDVLSTIKEASFWLECAANVFCHAFDEAAALNSNSTGLLDDYRCFKTHGEMVLEHLSRMQKRATALPLGTANAQTKVQSRLDTCEEAIMRLSEATQAFIVNEADSPNASRDNITSVLSVFERANSFSDLSSSNSTSQSSQISASNSGISSRTGTGFDDERAGVHIINTDTAMNVDMDTPKDVAVEMQLDDAVEVSGTGKGKEPMQHMWSHPQIANVGANMGDGTMYQSPDLAYSSAMPWADNPYTWHVPYPPTQDTIPAPPSPEDEGRTDGAMTEVPTPQIPAASPIDTDMQRTGSRGGFELRYPRADVPNHRVIQRNNERRYHDRAGAWRAKDASDPRRDTPSSLSCEPATGSVIMPLPDVVDLSASGTTTETTGSAAKMSLSKFRTSANQLSSLYSKVNPFTSAVGGQHKQSKSRAQSTGAVGVRPLLDVQQNIQALEVPASQDASEGDPFPPSSYGSSSSNTPGERGPRNTPPIVNSALRWMAKYLPHGSASAMLRNQEPSQSSENNAGDNGASVLPTPDTDDDIANSIETLLRAQPGPVHRGPGTSSSTPTHGHGPFQPPAQHKSSQYYCTQPAGLPQGTENTAGGTVGGYGYGSTQYGLPSAIPRWESDIYHPGQERLSSSDLSLGISGSDLATDQTSGPGPSSLQAQQPHQASSVPVPAQFLRQHLFPMRNVDGYSSQPMSRNTSAQSQPSGQVQGFPPGYIPSMPAFSAGQIHPMDESEPHSHSLPQSFDGRDFDGQGMPARAQQIPLLRRNSRSSLVQTEPSPQLENPLADVNTSYRQWERHVHLGQHGYSERFVSYEMRRMMPEAAPPPPGPRVTAQRRGSRSGNRSGSRSGSGSGSDSGAGSGHGRPWSTSMSRSQSDQGPGTIPEVGAWVPTNPPFPPMGPPPATREAPYPSHMANVGEQDAHSAQPMSRSTSETSNGSAQARRATGGRR